jgi:deoxyribodipyrimidine photo-lyase
MYYSSGMLSVRKVLKHVEDLIEEVDDSDKIRNFAKYRNELAWREFFYQVLWHNPEAVQENYKDFENEIDWRNDSEEFNAWKNGRTGVPFVDAGIRELRKTGYMHNRTRQNVASFLTKHLMIDWRKGAKFFRKHLVDHDTASNNGGWQWSASTGTDSVPIRIFNPVKQGRKYDTHAKYIKRHIPELKNLDPNSIHNWVEMSQEERNKKDTEYPDPIINFNQRYHQGKKMFENALGK